MCETLIPVNAYIHHVVCGVATHGQNRAGIQYVAVSLTKLLCSAVTRRGDVMGTLHGAGARGGARLDLIA